MLASVLSSCNLANRVSISSALFCAVVNCPTVLCLDPLPTFSPLCCQGWKTSLKVPFVGRCFGTISFSETSSSFRHSWVPRLRRGARGHKVLASSSFGSSIDGGFEFQCYHYFYFFVALTSLWTIPLSVFAYRFCEPSHGFITWR